MFSHCWKWLRKTTKILNGSAHDHVRADLLHELKRDCEEEGDEEATDRINTLIRNHKATRNRELYE